MTTTAPETTTIERLDFDPPCESDCKCHGDCTSPAEFSAHLHDCNNPAGHITLICSRHLADLTAAMVHALRQAPTGTSCGFCGTRFTDVSQIIWDARPLR